MPRGKGKGNLKTFVFSIDADDVKYQDLINYLESIDNGARSYVIRQILNSYIGNQCVIPVNSVPPVVENTNVATTVSETEKVPTKPQETQNKVEKPVQGNRVKPKSFAPNKIKTVSENKEENIEKKNDVAKPEISDGMSKLLQNFQ